jgi:hypothetical protein
VSALAAAQIFCQVARAIGAKKTGFYLKVERGELELAIVSHPPTGVVAGQALLDAATPDELRFLMGRALCLCRSDYVLAATTEGKEFTDLFTSVLRAFHPRHSRRTTRQADTATETAQRLKKSIPYTVSKRLIEIFTTRAAAPWSSAKWRAGVLHTANRIGLVVGGDLSAALKALLREEGVEGDKLPSPAALRVMVKDSAAIRELLAFAVSEEYFAARAKLLGKPLT